MEIATIKGEKRSNTGRKNNRRLRERGFIPAVVYGHNQEPESLALSIHDFNIALEQAVQVVQVEVDGSSEQYLLKDVQFDHLQRHALHADLMRVNMDEKVEVSVPLVFRGEPEEGVVVHVLNELDVECFVLNIPHEIRIKIDQLKIGESLAVKDVALPEGVTVLNDPEDAVVSVQEKREVQEEPAEEEQATSAEPEVIGREKEDEDESEG